MLKLQDLYKSNFVMGEGPIPCEVMLIGEAPGKDEDFWQKPFIGRAGNQLVRLLRIQTGLKREEVYITNSVKQRPPNNRIPLFSEVISHREFLLEEIKIVKPKVIVCLGKTAIKAILGKETKESIDFHRKYKFLLFKIPVICTYHPASLLYGSKPAKIEEDFRSIKTLLQGVKK